MINFVFDDCAGQNKNRHRQRDALLVQRLTAVMDELAEAAKTRDPDRFETLISGSAGVNPVFDAWKRLKAFATGKRASVRHRDI